MVALFKDILGAGERLIKNEDALDFEFVPKMLPFRENQQRAIAACINPLLQGRNGRNALIFGLPGVGKTAATRWVLRDLEETSDEVVPLYINCWQRNTSHKIVVEICSLLGYAFVQNKRTEELFEIVKNILNKKQAVFVLDEIDKLEEQEIIYSILNDIYKKSVLLIANSKEMFDELDERIKSRLTPEILEFKQYNKNEITEILRQRVGYAFVPGCWQDDALRFIAEKAFEKADVRAGIYLLREAALAAEEQSSKRITLEHAEKAVSKLANFTIKNSADLGEETREILGVIKENSGKKIGDLFEMYKRKNGGASYKTFQRHIEKLAKGKFIELNKTSGGVEGNTTIVSYAKTKKLDEF
jgi:cell division control protein 6